MTPEEIVKRFEEVTHQMRLLGEIINDFNKCQSPVSKKFVGKAMEQMAKSICFFPEEKLVDEQQKA